MRLLGKNKLMSVKRYGIYLSYAPNAFSVGEGLVHVLVNILKGMLEVPDVHLLIACPPWVTNDLIEMLRNEGIETNRVEIFSPIKYNFIFKGMIALHKKWIAKSQPQLTQRKKRFSFLNFLKKMKALCQFIIALFMVKGNLVIFSIMLLPITVCLIFFSIFFCMFLFIFSFVFLIRHSIKMIKYSARFFLRNLIKKRSTIKKIKLKIKHLFPFKKFFFEMLSGFFFTDDIFKCIKHCSK